MAGKNSMNVAGLVDGSAGIARSNAAEITAKGVQVEELGTAERLRFWTEKSKVSVGLADGKRGGIH